MIHLIYTSTERQAFSAADLKKLLIRSRTRNATTGVTGMLLYDGGIFVQAIEGDEAAIAATFTRIEKDPRHIDLQVLHRAATLGRRRLFGDWAMGFADASGAAHILKGFIQVGQGPRLAALDRTSALDVLMACGREPSRQSA
jgi:hypothetical protein